MRHDCVDCFGLYPDEQHGGVAVECGVVASGEGGELSVFGSACLCEPELASVVIRVVIARRDSYVVTSGLWVVAWCVGRVGVCAFLFSGFLEPYYVDVLLCKLVLHGEYLCGDCICVSAI